MNKKETAQIIATLKEYYPKDFTSTDLVTKVEAWYLVLKDYDYYVIQNAVISFVAKDTKGFPPVVGQLIDQATSISKEQEKTELEAWEMVYKAICNSAYNSAEEFNKLPSEIQRAVGSADMLKSWSQLDIEQVQTVIQSNVMRSYKVASKQKKEYDVLPENVKKFTLELADKKDLKLLS
jgi:hypothetical protein